MPSAGNNCLDAAMWGLLPEIVLTNCLSGLQAPDWYEKLERQRSELARQIRVFDSACLYNPPPPPPLEEGKCTQASLLKG